MPADYFSYAQFRSFANDPLPAEGEPKYLNADIERAQIEVVEHLEQWAGSAWPTVVEQASPDEIGWTTVPRRRREQVLLAADGRVRMAYAPIISIEAVEVGGEEVEFETQTFRGELASFTLSVPSLPRDRLVVLDFTYGHTSTPWAIRRPAMMATKSLLDGEEGRGGKIPSRVSRYDTEGTTFLLERDEPKLPWPWDPDASAAVHAWWGARRPRSVAFV